MKQIDDALEKLGYGISNITDGFELRVGYNPKPVIVRAHYAETARVEKTLADLTRTYTLKLFAGGEEAKELFASLQRELSSIITR